MEKKSGQSKLIIVLVLVGGGFVLLACGGVLAAIAIPSFVKYTQKSKAVEASMTTRQMASYAQMVYTDTCAFPPPLKRTSQPSDCCGGEKCVGQVGEPWAGNVPSLAGPNYFSYSAVPDGSKMHIVANADFDCGGQQHTVTLTINGKNVDGVCETELEPELLQYELQ